ncbi:MAG: hypothetical protein KC431_21925 [Myxococcales bacterium]|nr:hypothetical protein [Myxococcales bacterium]
MDEMSEFLVSLVESLPSSAGGPEYGVAITVTEIELALPIEARFTVDREIELSTPRTRLATGFAVEYGRIAVRFEEVGHARS